MFFKIDKKILATNDGIYTGVVIVEGIDNKNLQGFMKFYKMK